MPKTRLFLVAYEGADGRPYAVAPPITASRPGSRADSAAK